MWGRSDGTLVVWSEVALCRWRGSFCGAVLRWQNVQAYTAACAAAFTTDDARHAGQEMAHA